MNGVHHLGGPEVFGAVGIESDEPAFRETVEGRSFALNLFGVGVGRVSA